MIKRVERIERVQGRDGRKGYKGYKGYEECKGYIWDSDLKIMKSLVLSTVYCNSSLTVAPGSTGRFVMLRPCRTTRCIVTIASLTPTIVSYHPSPNHAVAVTP